ncbi:MAG: macro domain-containing protein [Nitrososphaerota archaeon]|nr:macro domain-containing protein [Nitrososphaerota archaeon]
MIKILEGNLLDSGAQTLVNTVNTVGIMGKGIALEFKERFPDMFRDYAERCRRGEVKLGQPYLYKRLVAPWILNFPTKEHWRSLARLDDIIRGLEYLEKHYEKWGIVSIAFPPLGCGNGQLEWRVVGSTLYRALKRFTIPVELYAPRGTPPEELLPRFLDHDEEIGSYSKDFEGQLMEPGWVAMVEVLNRIERNPYHYQVGRTMFQKIAYFLTDSGIPTGLNYYQGSFGPYASELMPILTRLQNHSLIQEERDGPTYVVKVGPTFRDAERVFRRQLADWDSVIEGTANLFMRLTTRQAELVATVHFAARKVREELGRKPTELEVLNYVLQWKKGRKPSVDRGEVADAIRSLNVLHLLDTSRSKDLPMDRSVLLTA